MFIYTRLTICQLHIFQFYNFISLSNNMNIFQYCVAGIGHCEIYFARTYKIPGPSTLFLGFSNPIVCLI